jgi:hypothetical protein
MAGAARRVHKASKRMDDDETGSMLFPAMLLILSILGCVIEHAACLELYFIWGSVDSCVVQAFASTGDKEPSINIAGHKTLLLTSEMIFGPHIPPSCRDDFPWPANERETQAPHVHPRDNTRTLYIKTIKGKSPHACKNQCISPSQCLKVVGAEVFPDWGVGTGVGETGVGDGVPTGTV